MISSIDNDQVLVISILVPYLIPTVPPGNARPVSCTPPMANFREV